MEHPKSSRELLRQQRTKKDNDNENDNVVLVALQRE